MLKSRLAVLLSLLLVFALIGSLAVGCGEKKADDPTPVVDNWPEREIRVIVPFAAGGGTDTSARQIQPYLEKQLGVPLVIDNRGGGNTIIGTTMLKEARPDGYTIGVFAAPHFDFSIVTLGAPYKLEDFEIVGVHAADPGLIRIHKDETRFTNFQELIEYARKHPGEVTFSVSAITSSNYLGLKIIEQEMGVEFNIVNFDGGNPARVALAGKHVDATHAGVFNSLHIADDSKVIAVHYHENKWPDITDNAPTINELLGKAVADTGSFYFMIAPAQVKVQYPARFEKLCQAYEAALMDPEFIEAMKKIGEDTKYIYLDHVQGTEFFKLSISALEKYKDFFK